MQDEETANEARGAVRPPRDIASVFDVMRQQVAEVWSECQPDNWQCAHEERSIGSHFQQPRFVLSSIHPLWQLQT